MIDLGDPVTRVRLRVLRIIAGALLLGVIMFLAVAFFIVWARQKEGNPPPVEGPPLLTWVAVGLLVMNAVLSVVMLRIGLRSNPAGLPGVQSALIMALAPLEAAGLMGGIAYLQEARPLALVVAGLALLLMLAHFPTDRRVQALLDRQKEILDQARRSSL
jgi:hypothetical protein